MCTSYRRNNFDKDPMYQDKTSLESFFLNHLQSEGSSAKTQKNYITDLREFFTFLEVVFKFEAITPQLLNTIDATIVDHYKQFLLGQSKSESTVQRRISSLRTFFRACENARLINKKSFFEQKEKLELHPLVHVWKGHLEQHNLPVEMSHHAHDFLLWLKTKHTH